MQVRNLSGPSINRPTSLWRSENIQKRLLTEVDLTLAGTDKLAQMMEAPNQYSELMKGKPEGTISKVSHNQKSVGNSGKWEQFKKKEPCYCCGKQGHAPRKATVTLVVKRPHSKSMPHPKNVNLAGCVKTDQSPSGHILEWVTDLQSHI